VTGGGRPAAPRPGMDQTGPDMTTLMDRLMTGFPALRDLDVESRRLLEESARPATLAAGTQLFLDGDPCTAFTLVLDGAVRVQKVSESGRRIVLYRVEPGQTCVLTTNALMAASPYGAEGLAETDLSVAIVPLGTFQRLLAVSDVFRRFVFSAYATRISDLLLLIEEVAFARIDTRLAHLLLSRSDPGGEVRATHHDLATELGSAREVISRQLKEFERQGWISAARGRVMVTDRGALERLRQGSEIGWVGNTQGEV